MEEPELQKSHCGLLLSASFSLLLMLHPCFRLLSFVQIRAQLRAGKASKYINRVRSMTAHQVRMKKYKPAINPVDEVFLEE
jgi:hypothetical protein